jgi:hypothetical protein
MGTRGTISTRAMRKQCPSASCSRHFRDAPDFGLPTPKSGYGFLNPGKAPFGAGRVRFSYTGGPPGALYRIWFNAYLTT